jgi:hypothetical protein
MDKYEEPFCQKMREIYKAVLKRIRLLGKTDEVDVLFLHLYKTEFEQTTSKTK